MQRHFDLCYLTLTREQCDDTMVVLLLMLSRRAVTAATLRAFVWRVLFTHIQNFILRLIYLDRMQNISSRCVSGIFTATATLSICSSRRRRARWPVVYCSWVFRLLRLRKSGVAE